MSAWQAILLAVAIIVTALILSFDAGRSRDRAILRARRREKRRRERDAARRSDREAREHRRGVAD